MISSLGCATMELFYLVNFIYVPLLKPIMINIIKFKEIVSKYVMEIDLYVCGN